MTSIKSKLHTTQEYRSKKKDFKYDDAKKLINNIINKGGKATFKTTKGDKRVEINEEDNALIIDKKRYRYNRETKSLVNKLVSISNNLVSKTYYITHMYFLVNVKYI